MDIRRSDTAVPRYFCDECAAREEEWCEIELRTLYVKLCKRHAIELWNGLGELLRED